MAIGTGAAILGGSVLGGLLGGNSAKSAASAQERAAAEANATQRYMYDQTRADNAPFRDAGVAANNRLAYLLGIGGGAGFGGELGSTNGEWKPNANLYATSPSYKSAWDSFVADHRAQYGMAPNSDAGSLAERLPEELKNRGFDASTLQGQNVGDYGSLLKKFGQSDLDNDVVYNTGLQFGLDQGTQGINRMAAASGSQLSGATLKALTRFGNDYGNTKANEAYNRYNTTNDSIYNKLAGLSGAGQQATGQVSSAGQNYANQVGNTQQALGNARGASAIAQGNALSGALGQGINAYQQQNYLNSLSNNGYGGYNEEMNRLMGQS